MKAKLVHFTLDRIYRQKDKADGALLSRVRTGSQTDKDLARLNERVQPVPPENAVILSVFNRDVDRMNSVMLDGVTLNGGKEHVFEASRSGSYKRKHPDGNYVLKGPYKEEITLRIGCRVIIKENGKYKQTLKEWDGVGPRDIEYVNGDTALFIGVDPLGRLLLRRSSDNAPIKLKASRVRDTRFVKDTEIIELEDEETGETSLQETIVSRQVSDGEYRQYPITLGYAQTIASAQGQTLDSVHIILPSTDWMKGKKPQGLVYVALSRVKSLNSLTLSRKLLHTDIWCRKGLTNGGEEQYDLGI